jgi:putative membrane protein
MFYGPCFSYAGFGGSWFGPVFMLLVWTLIVLAVLWAIRAARGAGGISPAQRILDRRFASGEIDEEEYRKRRALLA